MLNLTLESEKSREADHECMKESVGHNSYLVQARKSIPIDRLEHLRSQLSSSTHMELSGQLEEVLAKLEPPDSASSSRRSSISSHVSPRINLTSISVGHI